MKRLYIAIGIFLLLVVCAVLFFFFNKEIISVFNRITGGVNIETQVPFVSENKPEVLTKEEQVELLDDLLPEEVIDTEEEIQEQVDLLEQLQNGTNNTEQDITDQFNVLSSDTDSVESQLELLNQLQGN